MDKIIYVLIFCLVFVASAMLTHEFLKEEQTPSFNIAEEYQDQFAATCGVSGPLDLLSEEGGTGVLLSNGRVITAKHVVDDNRNGLIDDDEKSVLLRFYYPKEFICTGTVVFAPQGRLRVARGYDFVVIEPGMDIKSNIKLATVTEHLSVGAGEQIYTIGRTDCQTPHITFGNQSTKLGFPVVYDRTDLPIWYGNSGGGIFRKDDGKLIGIAIIMKRSALGRKPDLWTGYMSATDIRFHLAANDSEHLIESIQDTRAFKLQNTFLYLFILLNCFLGVYFGLPILCKRVWYMQRANAPV